VTQAQLIADLGSDVVFFAWAASVAFLAVYTGLARGYRTDVGKMLITMDAGLAMALTPAVLHRLFGFSFASLVFAWFTVASIALIGAATWWRVWFVIRVQADGIGLTPRQFAWHLMRGAWNAVRSVPGRLRKARDGSDTPGPEGDQPCSP
jgi:hypothetical protein